jgi:predicted DNA-binding transcriptional regulator
MIGVLGVFGILAWIGYTLATTPPPKPIEEIEKEIEEELKKLEKEMAETTAKAWRCSVGWLVIEL